MTIKNYFEFYNDGCKDDAEVIVFLPGVACSTWMFRDAVEQLTPKYKVLIFNNPGTAKISLPFNLTVKKIATKVLECIKYLGIEKCTFIGHSMGGFTAQEIAINNPELVEKLIIISSSPGGKFNYKEAKRIFKEIKPNIKEMWVDFSSNPEKSIDYTFSDEFKNKQPVKYKIFANRFYEMRPKKTTILRHFICASRYTSYNKLNKIKADTLIIHGNEDHLINIEGGKILADKIKKSSFLEIDKCGHFPMIEKIDFYKDIIRFIES